MRHACTVAALAVALPALADEAGGGQTGCHPREMWIAWLKAEHGLALHSWGLDDDGRMVELFLRPDGHFAILTTTAGACTRAAMPAKERGRLSEPLFADKPVPDPIPGFPPGVRLGPKMGTGNPL